MHVTQALADFAAGVTFDKLPSNVVHQTKRVILDCIGCVLGGYSTEKGRIVRHFAKVLGGNPEATIIGSGDKTSCVNSAFVNGSTGNALDSDDTMLLGHPAVPIVFAALPIAERNKITGRDLLVAVTTGYDIACRIVGASECRLKVEDGMIRDIPVYGYSWYILGAAIAAAKVLNLDAQQMTHVMGLAGMIAPIPAMRRWSIPADSLPLTKYHETGWTSQGGLSAAMLVQMGYTAPTEILDGKTTGFHRMMGYQECNLDFMLGKLGQKWWITDTAFKEWPCCKMIHWSLTAFANIIDEHDVRAEEIERVTIKGGVLPFFGSYFAINHPKDLVNMEFSAPYAMANVAFKVEPGPKWFHPETAENPEIKKFREKVYIESHHIPEAQDTLAVIAQDLAGEYPRTFKRVPTTVEVKARGKTYTGKTEYVKGDPVEGMSLSDEELRRKFKSNAIDIMSISPTWRERVDRAAELIYQLENMEDISQLMSFLSP